ncbi:cytochrome C oxidase subunit II [Marinicrinis lubricantis]|uniref:Cytochrome C oxidase subunit II n=1 Tax=Marinicrinis lubricantis TaxID=2086470 RepID=A0ABW1IN37_9BACL
MQKYVMLSLFLVAVVFAVVFSLTAIDGGEEAAEEEVKENELRIVAENFKFDQAEYTIEAGKTMIISMKNKPGGGIHGVEIEGTDINLQDGQSAEYTFEPGTYNIHCSVMCGTGHAEMVSKLIVTEPSGDAGQEEQPADQAEEQPAA